MANNCNGSKKTDCQKKEGCKWIVNLGCKDVTYITPPKKCRQLTKSPCETRNDCNWIKGKGCFDAKEDKEEKQIQLQEQKMVIEQEEKEVLRASVKPKMKPVSLPTQLSLKKSLQRSKKRSLPLQISPRPLTPAIPRYQTKVDCEDLRKEPCTKSKSCKWIINKGCKGLNFVEEPKPCKRLTKGPCIERKEDCKWIIGKGCRNFDEQVDESKVARSVKSKNPCKSLRKPQCAASKDCNWIVGHGCVGVDEKLDDATLPCYKLNKGKCAERPNDCNWIKGVGCRVHSYIKKDSTACSNYVKAECLEKDTCKWLEGVGCRPKNFVANKACDKRKRSDCELDDKCIFKFGRGCMSKEDMKREAEMEEIITPVPMSLLEPEQKGELISPPTNLKCIGDINIKLKEAQIRAINRFVNEGKDLLVVFGTGVGKTLTAVFIAKCYLKQYRKKQVIIATVKSVVEYFRKEGEKYIKSSRIAYVTHEELKRGFKANKTLCDDTLVIIDEVHEFRNSTSKGSILLSGCLAKSHRRVLMTATPFINKIDDLFTLVGFLRMREGKPPSFDLSNWESSLEGRVVYQGKSIDDANYPSYTEHYTYVDMTPHFEKAYIDELNKYAHKKINFFNVHRQIVNKLNMEDEYISQKMNPIMDLLMTSRQQSIIFTNWLESGVNVIKDVLKTLQLSYLEIHSRKSKVEREDAVNRYNKGDVMVLIITKAASLGIDLKNTRNVFILDPVWNPSTLDQIIGRAIRYKSHESLPIEERHVNIYYMILKESYIDPDIDLDLRQSQSGDMILYNIIAKKRLLKNSIEKTLEEMDQGIAEEKVSIHEILEQQEQVENLEENAFELAEEAAQIALEEKEEQVIEEEYNASVYIPVIVNFLNQEIVYMLGIYLSMEESLNAIAYYLVQHDVLSADDVEHTLPLDVDRLKDKIAENHGDDFFNAFTFSVVEFQEQHLYNSGGNVCLELEHGDEAADEIYIPMFVCLEDEGSGSRICDNTVGMYIGTFTSESEAVYRMIDFLLRYDDTIENSDFDDYEELQDLALEDLIYAVSDMCSNETDFRNFLININQEMLNNRFYIFRYTMNLDNYCLPLPFVSEQHNPVSMYQVNRDFLESEAAVEED